MGDVRVLFFARAKDITMVPSHVLSLTTTLGIDDFIQWLEEMWPGLKDIRGEYTLALNRELVLHGDACIRGGDEVALITPVSGG